MTGCAYLTPVLLMLFTEAGGWMPGCPNVRGRVLECKYATELVKGPFSMLKVC